MTEDLPHVVFSREYPINGVAWVCKNYKAAHDQWLTQHSYKTPYLIAVLGRVIDPSTPVVDVNE
jgi:hypothetical protein